MIASPDDANSSPLGDLLGFWLAIKPKEYYVLSGARELIICHGFGLLSAFAIFKSAKNKLEGKFHI